MLEAIEDRIAEYSSVSEAINLQLSARVMQNYNDFVTGMQMAMASPLTKSSGGSVGAICGDGAVPDWPGAPVLPCSTAVRPLFRGVLIKNGRRKLQIHDQGALRFVWIVLFWLGILRSSMQITSGCPS